VVIPNDPRLAAGELLYLATWRVQARRRALGGLSPTWLEGEGLAALLKAAETHDDAGPVAPVCRVAGNSMQRLLREARQYREEARDGA
jgi:hypothetical protein